MSYWKKVNTNKQIYINIYKYISIYISISISIYIVYTLYIDYANPTWTEDRFPVFYLSFECCQICKDFYFLRYGIPDFRSELWCRLFSICFSFNMINLKFCSWLMSKTAMILCKMKTFTNCTDSPLFTLNISMANFWRFLSWIVKELPLSRSSSKVH